MALQLQQKVDHKTKGREGVMKRTLITMVFTLAFTAFAIQAVEQKAFSGAGLIESTVGGFKFPDGSIQQSANPPACTDINAMTAPIQILNSGVYCLTANLYSSETDGSAINVNADNVVIDLKGWTLSGQSAGSATLATGISSYSRDNVTIRNGTVTGFHAGIFLADAAAYNTSEGHIVEDVHLDHNWIYGVVIEGVGSIVRRNFVSFTGLSTAGADVNAEAIRVRGGGSRIVNNDISTVAPCYAIRAEYADGATIAENRIDFVVNNGTGKGYGISIHGSNLIVRENSIAEVDYGIHFGNLDSGVYMNNVVSSASVAAYTGGTAAGVNSP